jgi:hypothetical protein
MELLGCNFTLPLSYYDPNVALSLLGNMFLQKKIKIKIIDAKVSNVQICLLFLVSYHV